MEDAGYLGTLLSVRGANTDWEAHFKGISTLGTPQHLYIPTRGLNKVDNDTLWAALPWRTSLRWWDGRSCAVCVAFD